MTLWIVIAVCGVFCYLLRFLPVEVLGRIDPPPWLDRVSAFSAPVAFSALAVAALAAAGTDGTGMLLPRLLAATVGAVVAYRTRSVGVTIAAGMGALWLATLAFG